MKFALAAGLVTAGLALAPIASPAAEKGDRPPGFDKAQTFMADATTQKKVATELAKDKGLSASGIKVEVAQGYVKLSGKARSNDEADKASSIARRVDGVKGVQNTIQVTGR